jgi:hypothetical protein
VHGVDPDVMAGELVGQRPADADHGVLGRHVGGRKGMPLRPAVELVAMIDPPPAAMRWGTATTMVFQTPVRFVSMVSCHTCGVTWSHGCTV